MAFEALCWILAEVYLDAINIRRDKVTAGRRLILSHEKTSGSRIQPMSISNTLPEWLVGMISGGFCFLEARQMWNDLDKSCGAIIVALYKHELHFINLSIT